MNRIELYAKIKELGLAEECKKVYGKNMTNCTTAALESLIDNHNKSVANAAEVKKENTVAKCKNESLNFNQKVKQISIDVKAREAIKAIGHILNIDINKYFK
jgi:hypothetical protein